MSLQSSVTPTSVLPDRASGTKKLLVNNAIKTNGDNHLQDPGPGKGKKKLSSKPALDQDLAILVRSTGVSNAIQDALGQSTAPKTSDAIDSLDAEMATQPDQEPGVFQDLIFLGGSAVDAGDNVNNVDDAWIISEDSVVLPPGGEIGDANDVLDADVEANPDQIAASIASVLSLLPLHPDLLELIAWEYSLSPEEISRLNSSWHCLDQELKSLSNEDYENILGSDAHEQKPSIEAPVTMEEPLTLNHDADSYQVIDITDQVNAALNSGNADTADIEILVPVSTPVVSEPSPIAIDPQFVFDDILNLDPFIGGEAPIESIFSDAPISGFDENFQLAEEPTGPTEPEAPVDNLFVDPDVLIKEEAMTKRGRGRPRLERPEVPVPPATKRRGRPPKPCNAIAVPPISENLSEVEKYRRLRDLNNAASIRCRMNRKRKMEEFECKVKEQEIRNECLLDKIKSMKHLILKLRAATDSCPYCKKKMDICSPGH